MGRPPKDRELKGIPLRIHLLLKGMTHDEFADLCKLKSRSIPKLLETQNPKVDTLISIINGTNCDPTWLVTGKGTRYGQEKAPAETAGAKTLNPYQQEVITLVAHCQKLLAKALEEALSNPDSDQRLKPLLDILRTLEALKPTA